MRLPSGFRKSQSCNKTKRRERARTYNARMYIIAIGWLWVVLMMAVTESNLVAGILTFVFYGLFPCSLLIWLLGTPARRRRQAAEAEAAPPSTDDRRDGS